MLLLLLLGFTAQPEPAAPAAAPAVTALQHAVMRPPLAAAQVPGHQVAKPGTYQVSPGDLIEIGYSYLPQSVVTIRVTFN